MQDAVDVGILPGPDKKNAIVAYAQPEFAAAFQLLDIGRFAGCIAFNPVENIFGLLEWNAFEVFDRAAQEPHGDLRSSVYTISALFFCREKATMFAT